MKAPSLKTRFLLLGFLGSVLAKFWLIWQSEITDATDDPHEYVLQILYPSNGGLVYPPGTGLVGQCFAALGIPFRLGLEITYLIAAALVLRVLIAWPWKTALSLGLFILLIFDPAVAELFSHLFSDEVWLIETMLGLSCFVLAIEKAPRPNWARLSLSILFLGLASITRSILIPFLTATILFALLVLVLVLSKYRAKTLRPHLDLVALSVPSLIFGLILVYANTCLFDSSHHGYTGISYLDSDQYKKFYLCLQSVGEPTGAPYFPIDENRRKLIAQAGPDSKWFIDQLESNGVYKQVGLDHYGKYDIPAGWFHWAAFSAAMDPAQGNYLHAFSLFKSIESEIAAANQLGLIKVRPVIALPDSRLSIVIATLPSGLHHTAAKILHEPSPHFFTSLAQPSRYLSPEFTQALNRRTITPSPERETIWHFLSHLYCWIYTRVTLLLYLVALLAFTITLILHWKRLPEFPLNLIPSLFFTTYFVIFLLWYALFDASGMPVLNRYMIFNHLLLIPLIFRYLITTASLLKNDLKTSSS